MDTLDKPAQVGLGPKQSPEERRHRPLAAVSIRTVGRETVAQAGAVHWNIQTGQQLLDLGGARSSSISRRSTFDSDEAFARAVRLEETDLASAARFYAELVSADPSHADAHVNLGRIRHQQGRLREAQAHYLAALASRPADVTAEFNLAVVLEDLGELDDAMKRYEHVLQLDPQMADACFNLAKAYERKGEKLAAIRHLKTCRTLQRVT